MSREFTRTLANCQEFNRTVKNYSGDQQSPGVMIFGFLEESVESSDSSWISSGDSDSSGDYVAEEMEDDNDVDSCSAEKNKMFWESQDQLLQATLRKSSSAESKIRKTTKETISDIKLGGTTCACRKPVADCRNCLQKEISLRLQTAKYNCAICKSKWMSTREIPSGDHTYLEVVDNSNISKGEIRVVIELNFRAEFEIARAGDDYCQLTNRLPEVFVGKIERLRAVVKILCSASKKCMKERKVHIAPWRKQKYMQAKWVGVREMNATAAVQLPSGRRFVEWSQPRQRASMLSFDMLEASPALHCQAIKVL
ncbi:putative Sugar phosphate exchanger 2 [Heracleum sosnowskyi]|uniref:Sugar phosphate exchanger 2 n=1 Tax=Heracleum sosnowskyi TaxID=360622 RepID=A0AAD8IN70_9APIA|nr:putative Sugar phosphate exchanger 2 [Heracleum sosnowskyi]